MRSLQEQEQQRQGQQQRQQQEANDDNIIYCYVGPILDTYCINNVRGRALLSGLFSDEKFSRRIGNISGEGLGLLEAFCQKVFMDIKFSRGTI